MLIAYAKRLIVKNREFILTEVLAVKGLMQLLMKSRNTGERWTRAELREIRTHLWHLSHMVPVILLIVLPGGSLLLPFLAEVLDRRKVKRR
jgi:hypothetical protein